MPTPAQEILVVDDDPDFLALLTLELEQIPGTVITTAKGDHEAVGRMREKAFALIISDWDLDTRTGPEMLTRADPELDGSIARTENGKTPVLFISGSDKTGAAHDMQTFQHFEPVSFMLKRCGVPLISLMAGHLVHRFDSCQDISI